MAKVATSAAYNEVEKFIYLIIHKFQRKYGGELDDYLLDAHEIFMYACGRYTEEKGKFITYLGFLLNCLLMERVQKETKFKAHLKRVDANLSKMARPERADRLYQIMEELSEDAKTVVELALDIPAEVRLILAEKNRNPKSFEQEVKWGKSIRSGISEFLEDIGWSIGRIDKVFEEIQEAL